MNHGGEWYYAGIWHLSLQLHGLLVDFQIQNGSESGLGSIFNGV